jgi:hypothetical protein
MIKRISKRTTFLLSIIVVGIFGFVQNVFKDNLTRADSTFRKEKVSLTPDLVEKVYADVVTPPSDGSDGCGDGSNGF